MTFFHHTVKASDKLQQLQQEHNQSVKKFIQDVERRLNFTHRIMERYLEQKELVPTTVPPNILHSSSSLYLVPTPFPLHIN
ncbi:hypothetical protein E2C01_024440 [Portunus trituberculatus]|uniref:Uncharacterized protein n=1 Tax=Portunus trituberculatus TaxID=210409 RepID=A0A5B7EAN3_PORTR|nr:hypothetical protein [Portunus trituberculatus]